MVVEREFLLVYRAVYDRAALDIVSNLFQSRFRTDRSRSKALRCPWSLYFPKFYTTAYCFQNFVNNFVAETGTHIEGEGEGEGGGSVGLGTIIGTKARAPPFRRAFRQNFVDQGRNLICKFG